MRAQADVGLDGDVCCVIDIGNRRGDERVLYRFALPQDDNMVTVCRRATRSRYAGLY